MTLDKGFKVAVSFALEQGRCKAPVPIAARCFHRSYRHSRHRSRHNFHRSYHHSRHRSRHNSTRVACNGDGRCYWQQAPQQQLPP